MQKDEIKELSEKIVAGVASEAEILKYNRLCNFYNTAEEEWDEKLYGKIIETDSLILSEYEGKMAAALWMFPQRNRIVAGISDAVLIVEGAKNSGSMITAKLARR